MKNKYSVVINMRGYMPDSEPIECTSLAEAKSVLKSEVRDYIEMNYIWDKWENMSYLRASDFDRYSSFVIGVLMPEDSDEHTIGLAVSIHRIIE